MPCNDWVSNWILSTIIKIWLFEIDFFHLAERIKDENLDILCIPSSFQVFILILKLIAAAFDKNQNTFD